MISGYKTLGFRDRILHFLLWILQTLILCQETCSRWWEAPGNQLRAGLEAFKGTSYRANPRGRQPAFPKTVAIIFAEEWLASVSLDGLAALLHWASAAGVRRLQVYDKSGKFKTNAASLGNRLNFASQKYNIQVANASSEGKVLVKEYEAISSSEGDAHQKVVVTLLSKEDGRRPLYAAILASPDSHKGLDKSKSPETLLEQIKAASGPELVEQPELIWDAKQTQMQVFGPVLTLAGFPPWMVRHSEIHAMGLLQDITEQRVDNALKKYCQTSQRFGS